jgi:hypothetical protein
LWAEWLREDVLMPVAHRHVVLTIPRLLRPLFRRRRELLGELARAGAEAVKELVRHASSDDDAGPGLSSRSLPRETCCSGILTCISSPAMAAELPTAPGIPCRSGTAPY